MRPIAVFPIVRLAVLNRERLSRRGNHPARVYSTFVIFAYSDAMPDRYCSGKRRDFCHGARAATAII
jgi:hypothetical protein